MSQDIDPRTLELINADIDGELSPAEQAQLQQRLQTDPSALERHAQLRHMAEALSLMTPVEPPAGLRQRWQPAERVAPTAQQRQRRRRLLVGGMAIAATGLFVALGLAISGGVTSPAGTEELVATMAPAVPEGSQAHRVELAALRGNVRLEPADAGWNLVFELDATEPVSVIASFEPEALRLDGFTGGDSGQVPFRATPGRIAFVQRGAQHLSLHLRPDKGGPIDVHFQAPQGIEHDFQLQLPPAAP